MLRIALESDWLKLSDLDLNAIESHFLHFFNTFATTLYCGGGVTGKSVILASMQVKVFGLVTARSRTEGPKITTIRLGAATDLVRP